MVVMTDHFKERFKQRVANTKRVQQYADSAFCYGKTLDEVRSKTFSKMLGEKEQANGSSAKIFSNCIYWFDGNVAITVYPIPQKMHKMI